MLTLKNTLNRKMTAGEERSFKNEIKDFLSRGLSLELDGVKVNSIDLWYQEQVEWAGRRRFRQLQQQLASTSITLILGVTYFESPDAAVSDIIITFVEDAKVSIINIFRGNEAYPFFYQIDSLQVKAIDQVTLSPVAAPEMFVEQRIADESNTASGGISGGG